MREYEIITAWGTVRTFKTYSKSSGVRRPMPRQRIANQEQPMRRDEAAWYLRMVRNHPHWSIRRVA